MVRDYGGQIYIESPYLENAGDKTRLCARCHIDNVHEYIVWYEVDGRYKEYICWERADAFVVNFLFYAMEHGLDIISEKEISERLHYQLREYLIPSISKWIDNYHEIKIEAPISDMKLETANMVGASLSGGVDSFYTLYKHLECCEMSYRITHLTFFNAGASGEYGGEKAREIYMERIRWIEDVASRLNLPLVCIDTNINEILMEVHVYTVTFRALAMVLALQKLFGIYYWSSNSTFDEFAFNAKDPEDYDLLTLQCLTTENTRFYLSGGEVTRMEKEEYISQFEVPRKKLNVCIAETINCSKCDKCQRTMLGLYALGKLDLFEEVFDLDFFYKNKETYYFKNLIEKRNVLHWNELYSHLEQEVNLVSEEKIKERVLTYISERIKGKKVVIRGAGQHTQELIRLFPLKKEFVCIWDRDGKNERFGGYPSVTGIDEVRECGANTIFISSYIYREEMKREMQPLAGEFEIIDIYEELAEKGIVLTKAFYWYDFR